MRAYIIASASTIALLALDDLRLRMRERRERRERVAAVADALGSAGIVRVDDTELPDPALSWKLGSIKLNNGSINRPVLILGDVAVSEANIWVGALSGATPAMDQTTETKKYCSAVWKAYRSRLAREAIKAR